MSSEIFSNLTGSVIPGEKKIGGEREKKNRIKKKKGGMKRNFIKVGLTYL